MTEIKELIIDLEDTELSEETELELEHEEKKRTFPKLRPFYIPWFWPFLY